MTKSGLIVRPVAGAEDWDAVRRIRTAVFIREQRCPPEEEWDEFDETSRHLLAWLGDHAIGVARWRAVVHEERVVAKLERFAILKKHRRCGYGRELVRSVMDDARQAGFSEFVLHAQSYLEDLYEGFGFHSEGEAFVEAGIPHVRMVLSEPDASSGKEPTGSTDH